MQDLKIEGIGTINGGEYGAVSIEGMGKCGGDLNAKSLSVEGMLRCGGSVRTGLFECEGTAKIHGNINADRINIEGMLTVTGGTRIEATEILCEGMIRLDGQISADRIDSDGLILAHEIVGDYIRIRSRSNWFFSFFRPKFSDIPLIEATTIELRGVIAQNVNGRDIYIDRGCQIENVDCSGTLFVSPLATVGNITGSYSKRDS